MKLPDASKIPPLIQLFHWIADPIGYMEANAQRYGDIFAAQVSKKSHPLVFVSNPQAIQKILTNDTKQFTAPGELNRILQPLLGDYSVIMVDGDRHRRQRQLLMPPFHGERMRSYGQLICDITEKVMNLTPGKFFSARSVMQDISLQVILQAVFGLHDSKTGAPKAGQGERYQRLKQLIGEMLELFRNPLTSSFLFSPYSNGI